MNSSPKKFTKFQKGPKHDIISPEDWLSDRNKGFTPDMAFTFSPPYRKGLPLMDLMNEYCSLFDELEHCELSVYPEMSCLGRIHFHGYIYIWDIGDILRFYHTDLQLLIQYGTVSIKVQTSEKDWQDYVFKQRFLMEIFMKEHGLKYHIEGPAPYEYLDLLNYPKQIKKVPLSEIPKVCEDSVKEIFKASLLDALDEEL